MSFCGWTFSRLALIGVLAAALGLAACGRKGPLDLPPAASAAGEQPAVNIETARPQTTQVPNKPLPIDVLLN
jgi:predicted small lipoprotein YifL